MDRVTTVMYERESRAARQREDEVRGNKTAYEIAADKVARSAGVDLRRQHEKQIGTAIHWILGSGSGACYGALRHVVPMRLGSGLAYGVLFWFVMVEAALTLLGVTAPPQAFPWQTHARGLVGHIVLGTTIEALFGAADLVRANGQ